MINLDQFGGFLKYGYPHPFIVGFSLVYSINHPASGVPPFMLKSSQLAELLAASKNGAFNVVYTNHLQSLCVEYLGEFWCALFSEKLYGIYSPSFMALGLLDLGWRLHTFKKNVIF